MADNKPTTTYYNNLGGINQKASEYALTRAQFLDIRNMDFDVPNALQKRPGSTQAVAAGTSGPVTSLFEFIKLDGSSYVVAGTDTAMFYLAVSTYTLLDTGWNNGQPTDMLTFVNKLWLANGQNYKWWTGSTLLPVGLPIQNKNRLSNSTNGPTIAPNFSIFGVTMGNFQSLTQGSRVALFALLSYVRSDGLESPVAISSVATSVGPQALSAGGSATYWSTPWGSVDYGNNATLPISTFASTVGYTLPSNLGITAFGLYFLLDSGTGLSLTYSQSNYKASPSFSGNEPTSYGLKSSTPATAFKFFTLVSPAAVGFSGIYIHGASNWFFSGPPSFSLPVDVNFFGSYTPKYIEVNQNSMFMSGFSSAPSEVWFSELGLPELVEPDYNFEVRTNDGDRIMAIKAYNNQLIVLKENSFHKVIGDSPENFELVELSQQFGCLSNKAIVEFKEELVWLDVRGVVRFNGAGWNLISTPVEDIFRRMNLSAAKENAVAVHYKYRNQVWFGIPVDNSTTNNLTVVWDYLIDAWTFFEGFDLTSAGYVKGYLARPTVWRGDESGLIHFHGEVFYGDNGQGITCTARPHWDKGKENETWIQRRLFLDVATASGLTGTITGKVFSDYNATTVQATYSMYQNAFQSRAEMGVAGKAFTTEWAHYSESLPFLVNGYSWAKRFLRNV